MKRLIEEIDITNWGEEVESEQPDLSSVGAAEKEQIQNERTPQQMGRMAVAGRAMGLADPNLVPRTKALVQMGAAKSWSSLMRSRIEKRRQGQSSGQASDNDAEVEVPKYIGPISNGSSDEWEPWVQCDDVQAARRASRYIQEVIPSHIERRLNVLFAHGKDVQTEIDTLYTKLCLLAGSYEDSGGEA